MAYSDGRAWKGELKMVDIIKQANKLRQAKYRKPVDYLYQLATLYKYIGIMLYKDLSDPEDFTTYNTSWNKAGFSHLNYWTDYEAFYRKAINICLN